MPAAAPFTVGIVGAGAILPHHLEAIRACGAFIVSAVCDADPARREAAAASLGARPLSDWRDLVAGRPDLVAVLLPHHLHAAVATAALDAGCHVLVEKPLAVGVAACRKLLAAAARAGRALAVAETAAADAGAARTGERFASGALGAFLAGSISSVRSYFEPDRPAWFLDPSASGGGMFANLGVHRLALARACLPGLGPVSVAAHAATAAGKPVEAGTVALVRYASRGSGPRSAATARSRPARERGRSAILFEEVGTAPRPPWLTCGVHLVFERGIVGWDARHWRLHGAAERIEEALPPAGPVYARLYAALAAALAGEGPLPSAEANALDVAVVEAAYASSREGREVSLAEPPYRLATRGARVTGPRRPHGRGAQPEASKGS